MYLDAIFGGYTFHSDVKKEQSEEIERRLQEQETEKQEPDKGADIDLSSIIDA